jgi:phage terminase Nu1 subunit (DNA packaging protein)
MPRGGKRAGSGRKPAPGESLESARRRKETALADLRQLEVQKRRGELLEAEAVAREWGDLCRTVRAGVLAVPSRIRQRVPSLRAQDVDVIDRELRDALAALVDADAG